MKPVATPRPWFRVEANAADPAAADLYIFDFIGDWIDDLWGMGGQGVTTAKSFLDALSALPDSVKTLRIHVNSPGGDVFSAVTIANMLRAQATEKGRTVEMSIEGLAASAASIVICAGDTIRMADNALVMIHNPWSWMVGDAAEMRQAADELDTIRGTIIATYRWVSSLSEDELAAQMDATTWMDADEALAAGFATEIVSGLKAAAALRPEALAKLGEVPEKYRARVAALAPAATAPPPPAPIPDPASQPEEPAAVARACVAAGFPALTEALITARATPGVITERLARARETAALCATAKLPDLAAGYVAADVPLATVRAQLTTLRARLDGVEIDGALDPEGHLGRTGRRAADDLSPRAIYAKYNTTATRGA